MVSRLWDIVKVPFPYTNRPVEQYRPAVVIGVYKNADAPVLLWVLMVTSAAHRRWQGDVEISDLQGAGLPNASVIRAGKIATIEAANAQNIGCLWPTDQTAVRANIYKILCFDPDRLEL